jgi:hypothetical protein
MEEKGGGFMKKVICVVLVLIVILFIGYNRVWLGFGASGKVIYDRYGISFEEELKREEAEAVKKVLSGKAIETALFGVPACGFDYDVAIIINGRRFGLALDGCGTVQAFDSMGYIHISDEDRQVLEKIFTDRGGVFPCI